MNKGRIMLLVTLLILWLSEGKAATVWGSTDRSPATGTMRFPVDISSVSTPGYLSVDDLNAYIWANPVAIVPIANGGLGVNLAGPGADRILFWDQSAGQYQYLTAGTGLAITDTTIAATSSGSGTVTSVNLSGGTTGLTYSGGPVTTNGTITTAGTLAVANGGTGATSAGVAQVNLNLIPGVDVQAWDTNLQVLADNACVPLSSGGLNRCLLTPGTDRIFVYDLGEDGGVAANIGSYLSYNSGTQTLAVSLAGKIVTTGTALTSSNLSTCGTSPAITGTDRKGVVFTGTGSTECTITFSSAYSAGFPICVVTQVGADTGLYIDWNTTQLTVYGSAWSGGEVFTYICEG